MDHGIFHGTRLLVMYCWGFFFFAKRTVGDWYKSRQDVLLQTYLATMSLSQLVERKTNVNILLLNF
jgi:hypothetical protein